MDSASNNRSDAVRGILRCMVSTIRACAEADRAAQYAMAVITEREAARTGDPTNLETPPAWPENPAAWTPQQQCELGIRGRVDKMAQLTDAQLVSMCFQSLYEIRERTMQAMEDLCGDIDAERVLLQVDTLVPLIEQHQSSSRDEDRDGSDDANGDQTN
jgi:hypothetical protein